MYKIGVIGDQDSIMGFLSLGIDIFAVKEADEIRRTIHKLANESYAIIYITEMAYMQALDAVNRYKDAKLPAIIVIPGIGEKIGLGMNEVRESAKRAIGADILFED